VVIDFNTMLSQVRMIGKMARMKDILSLIPWLTAALPKEALEMPDWKRVEAIILSMTLAERKNPDLLDGPRKTRIAAGSGTSVNEVSDLLWRLYQMRRAHQ
jgi:signal recognition particle subunit SRP54